MCSSDLFHAFQIQHVYVAIWHSHGSQELPSMHTYIASQDETGLATAVETVIGPVLVSEFDTPAIADFVADGAVEADPTRRSGFASPWQVTEDI